MTLRLASNGRTYTFPIATLSEDDQAHLAEWKDANPDIRLRISADKQSASRDRAKDGQKVTISEKKQFEVRIDNLGREEVSGLVVRYQLIAESEDENVDRKQRKLLSHAVSGEVEIDSIGPLRDTEFLTDAIGLKSVELADKGKAGGFSTYIDYEEELVGLNIEVLYKDRVVASHNEGRYEDTGTYGVSAEPARQPKVVRKAVPT